MTDREKAIKGLEHCDFGVSGPCYEKECPYYQSHDCTDELKNDILAMLKEQEAVKSTADDAGSIKPYAQGDGSYACNNCGETVGWEEMNCGGISLVKYKYCPECGRAVKW